MFSNVWSENTALFERLMEIHSNAPKLYYGFKTMKQTIGYSIRFTREKDKSIPAYSHTSFLIVIHPSATEAIHAIENWQNIAQRSNSNSKTTTYPLNSDHWKLKFTADTVSRLWDKDD